MPLLPAALSVMVALVLGHRLLHGGVGAGVGLGEAEGAQLFAGGQVGQVFFLLLLGAEVLNGPAAQGGVGGNGDTGAGAGLGDFLHRHDVFQGAHTHTAELLGDRNAQKADLAHLGDQLEGEALLLVHGKTLLYE